MSAAAYGFIPAAAAMAQNRISDSSYLLAAVYSRRLLSAFIPNEKNAHMAAAMGLLPDLLERHSLCNRPWTHDMRYLLSYLDPGHLCSNRQFIFRLRPLLVSVPTLQKA